MSDLSQNSNWFHSDLLKNFVLNILNNSKGVKVCDINIEQYPCQQCNREIFSFHPIILLSCGHAFHVTCINFNLDPAICPKCPVQCKVHIEEFEITTKCKKKTIKFEDCQKFKKLVNELLNEVLRHYYNLGEAIARSYDNFYKTTHDNLASKQKVNQKFKKQLQIETLDMALRKRKEQSKKIFSLFNCFNTNEDKFKGREMIHHIRSFSMSTISSLSWEKINIVKIYITNELDRHQRQNNNRLYNYF
ncbi:7394_t:CDS:2 [Gigaspora margarita]|uniref:7394_t:CDS:1 n=1 Tax=Gigaspora margarita TaxID=4874 RepID=A0ABN7UAX3_GIGMA|nr:7394_t:CDS:2 [Gigaspora margarita]